MYVFPFIFPTPETETENRVIWLKVGADWPMFALMVNRIPNLLPQSGSQCFPFYTYDEDGSNRRENITDWALAQFRAAITRTTRSASGTSSITSTACCTIPATANATRPTSSADSRACRSRPDFRAFAAAGARLAEIHVGYERDAALSAAGRSRRRGETLSYRVEKMRLSKDRTQIRYNDFLTLAGGAGGSVRLPAGQPLGAGVWVIDQYRVKTDKRSWHSSMTPTAPTNPGRSSIFLGRVIAVSLETVEIVAGLPAYRYEAEES